MKNQVLFNSKDKSKKLKCRLLHFRLALQGYDTMATYIYSSILLVTTFSVSLNIKYCICRIFNPVI